MLYTMNRKTSNKPKGAVDLCNSSTNSSKCIATHHSEFAYLTWVSIKHLCQRYSVEIVEIHLTSHINDLLTLGYLAFRQLLAEGSHSDVKAGLDCLNWQILKLMWDQPMILQEKTSDTVLRLELSFRGTQSSLILISHIDNLWLKPGFPPSCRKHTDGH